MSWVLLLATVFVYAGLAPGLTRRARHMLALVAAMTILAVVYVMFP